MPLYELRQDCFVPIGRTRYHEAGIRERGDLQRLLCKQIELIDDNLMVLSEEFGEWEDCRRRIDMLAMDRDGNLVVIELKRTDDGGHMELQALRYAAMVSTMTFDQAAYAHARFMEQQAGGLEQDFYALARQRMMEFLGWEEVRENEFAQDVRIILVAAEFSKEITTTALWLNQRSLDIRCVRAQPYALDGRLLVQVDQVVPLPEASDYQVRLREKEQIKKSERVANRDLTRFNLTLGKERLLNLPRRRAMLEVVKHLCLQHQVTPEEIIKAFTWRKSYLFAEVDGRMTEEEFKMKATARGGIGRYFTADDDLLHIGDRTYAVSNQWGPRTEEGLRLLTMAFPYAEIQYERVAE